MINNWISRPPLPWHVPQCRTVNVQSLDLRPQRLDVIYSFSLTQWNLSLWQQWLVFPTSSQSSFPHIYCNKWTQRRNVTYPAICLCLLSQLPWQFLLKRHVCDAHLSKPVSTIDFSSDIVPNVGRIHRLKKRKNPKGNKWELSWPETSLGCSFEHFCECCSGANQ